MASILDTPTSAAATPHTFAVSAGTNRCLIVGVTQEGTTLGAPTCTYGGQSMVNVVDLEINPGTTSQRVTIFFLNNAGIVAASGSSIAVSNAGSTMSINAASYQDCVQTTPTNTDTDSSTAATPNPLAACDITTGAANAVVIAVAGMGNDGTAAWASPLTERTEQSMATTATGSLADDEVATATTVACECTWTTPNRAVICALELAHLSAEGITSIDPTTFDFDAPDVDINGTNFEASQGSGAVYLSDADTLAGSANEVEIDGAINTWSDTVINLDFTGLSQAEIDNLNTLGPGQRYLIVVNNSSDEYGSAALTVHRAHAFEMNASGNITDTGENTTFQLTAPATKTTGDFGGGRITDLENPDNTTVDLTADEYREDEWCMIAKPLSEEAQYQFRVLMGGNPLGTYTVDPRWTVTGAIEVTGGTIASGSAVYPPSAAPGPVAVVGAHIASAIALFAPSLAYRVVAGTIAATLVLFAPTVSPGAVPVGGAHIPSAATLYAPSIEGEGAVTGGHIPSTAALYPPTLAVGAVEVSGGFIAPSTNAVDSFWFPDVSADQILYEEGIPRFAQSTTPGAGTLKRANFYLRKTGSPPGNVYAKLYASDEGSPSEPTGSPLATSSGVSAATLPSGASPEWIDFDFSGYSMSAATEYFISVEYDDGDVSNNVRARVTMGEGEGAWHPGHFAEYLWVLSEWVAYETWETFFRLFTEEGGLETVLVYAPSVSQELAVTGAHIASTAALYAPTVAPQAVGVTGAHIASGLALYVPSISTLVDITGGHVASTTTLYPPSVAVGPATVTGAHIASTLVLYPPTVELGAQAITGGTIASGSTLYAPVVSPDQDITGATIGGAGTPVSFVAANTTGSTPSGAQSGDFLFTIVWDTSSGIGPFTGWTKIGVERDMTSGYYLAFFWAVWNGSDAMPTGVFVAITAHRNCDAADPLGDWVEATGSFTPRGIGLVTADRDGDAAAYANGGIGTGGHTPPANYTERADDGSSDVSMGDRLNLDAEQTTGGDITAGSNLWASLHLVIQAEVGGGATLYPPSVTQELVVTGAHIPSGVTLYAPTVVPQAVGITGAHIASSLTLYPPVVALAGGPLEITAGHVASTLTLYPPTIVAEAAVAAAHIPSTVALYPPTVAPQAVTITGAHIVSGLVLYTPSISTGAVAVTGAHIASGLILYAPTVAPGAVAITGAHIASGLATYAPSISTEIAVTGGHVASTAVLYAPTVTTGAVTVTGAHIASGLVLYAPQVSEEGIIVGGHVASTATLYAPTVIREALITAGHVSSTLALYAPTVGVGPVTITGAHLTSTTTLYAPTVIPDQAVTGAHLASTTTLYAPGVTPEGGITTGHVSSTLALYAPTVDVGAVPVTGGHVSSTVALYAPSITVGAAEVMGAHIASGSVLYAPTVTTEGGIVGGHVASGLTLFAPTVTPGAVAVTGSSIGSTVQLFAPSAAYAVTTAHLAATTTLYPATITAGSVEVAGATIASTLAIYAPSVGAGATPVTAGHVASTLSLNAPEVSYQVVGAYIASGASLAPPSIVVGSVTITTVLIPSGTQLYGPSLTTYTLVASPDASSVTGTLKAVISDVEHTTSVTKTVLVETATGTEFL